MPLLVLTCALLGLLIGSFLNVVICRVPHGESVVSPASRCPACRQPLRRRDNVPVLSWLLLRGRCRGCAAPVSARYPLVELATAAVFALLAWRFGWSAALPAYLYLAAVGITLACIDLDVHRLPDSLTLPSYGVGIALLGVATAVVDEPAAIARALLGMVALYAVYFALALVNPGGMGFGDVKLAGVLGLYLAWLGWGPWFVGTAAAFLLGGLLGLLLILAGRAGRKTALPFGPFMLAGALIAVIGGHDIAAAYLRVSFA